MIVTDRQESSTNPAPNYSFSVTLKKHLLPAFVRSESRSLKNRALRVCVCVHEAATVYEYARMSERGANN